VDQKAAFNNFPYQYGVVERTFSEHQASALAQTLVSQYGSLPLELQDGAIQKAYQAAQLAGNGGNYADGTLRYFTCQSCHMRPTVGQGCNKNPPLRTDLPLHDHTGGNVWVPDAIQYLDGLGALRLGGGLTTAQIGALNSGKVRAQQNLNDAAALSFQANTLKVVNLTGHKLISGYPEGRRMWIRVAWRDQNGAPIATDGAYGSFDADVGGTPNLVQSLLDLDDPYAKVYEVHGAMTQEWASQLLALGKPADLPLAYDRVTGDVTKTLGQLAAEPPGSHQETFHFVLNNSVVKDSRIPPFGMRYDDALQRSILPVPASQYGAPGPGGSYDYFDRVLLDPPPGAHEATVDLLYQTTSWEYVQFLYLANTGASPFLGGEGDKILDAWFATGMSAPFKMTSIAWQNAVPACADGQDNDGDGQVDAADPGCSDGPSDESEHSLAFACDDRLDNDGDGLPDYPRDPDCLDPTQVDELPEPDDLLMLAAGLAALAALGARRRRRERLADRTAAEAL
jgi:MYXO-CTERM domain-containing protein